MSSIKTRAAAPRYVLPVNPPALELTADDEAIIWHAYRHRLIDAAMLRSLFPNRSPQKLTRRFNALRQARFLDRIGRHGRRRPQGGSYPEVYALGIRGAHWLRDSGVSIGARYWTNKNRALKSRSIEHLLETTEFMVALERSAQDHKDVRLIHVDEITGASEPDFSAPAGSLNVLRTDLAWRTHHGNEGTIADKIFGLENRDSDRPYSYYFLEIDRGTETIVPNERRIESRRFFRDSSFLRKMVVYAHAHRSDAHKAQYGMPNFRVVTVTTSPDRIALMQDAYKRHLCAIVRPGLFLFTDRNTVLSSDSILSIPFVTASGSKVQIP